MVNTGWEQAATLGSPRPRPGYRVSLTFSTMRTGMAIYAIRIRIHKGVDRFMEKQSLCASIKFVIQSSILRIPASGCRIQRTHKFAAFRRSNAPEPAHQVPPTLLPCSCSIVPAGDPSRSSLSHALVLYCRQPTPDLCSRCSFSQLSSTLAPPQPPGVLWLEPLVGRLEPRQ
jgi:hypothetical protein